MALPASPTSATSHPPAAWEQGLLLPFSQEETEALAWHLSSATSGSSSSLLPILVSRLATGNSRPVGGVDLARPSLQGERRFQHVLAGSSRFCSPSLTEAPLSTCRS